MTIAARNEDKLRSALAEIKVSATEFVSADNSNECETESFTYSSSEAHVFVSRSVHICWSERGSSWLSDGA